MFSNTRHVTLRTNRASKDRSKFTDTLDVMKFLCKDVWMILFKKQIDNLKTNHRGVYVLTDSNLRWLNRFAKDNSDTATTVYLHIRHTFYNEFIKNLTFSFSTQSNLTFYLSISFDRINLSFIIKLVSSISVRSY